MLDWTEYIKIFTTLLVIVDPVAIIPIFVSLTKDSTDYNRRHIAKIASISVAVILTVATLIGKPLLNFFGVSIASFKVGGGILLLLMAIAMMQAKYTEGKQTPEEAEEAEEKESIAVVPIAMPLLAGPGAISTVIIYSDMSTEPLHITFIIVTIILVAILTWVFLNIAIPVSRMLGKTGINIMVRLMGLVLAAIAAEFITGGLLQLLPRLGK